MASFTAEEAQSSRVIKPPALTRQLTSAFDNDERAGELQGELSTENQASLFSEAPSTFGDGAAAAVSSAKRSAPPRLRFEYRLGTATDIGGGSTNQDDLAVWRRSNGKDFVMAVFDGHGRELGELASKIAKDSMAETFAQSATYDEVAQNPQKAMRRIFKEAHFAIKEAFRNKYLADGWEVRDTEDGYVVKRPSSACTWSCTHGGTTATVVVVYGESGKMVVVNVGDSTALWGTVRSDGQCAFSELSADHSPESPSEFRRVRAFKASTTHNDPPHSAPNMAEMRFVYDAPHSVKHQCPAIFAVDATDAESIQITNNGNYYKNVRNEWASLVTTPPHARFQDALAFTRSLGDLHLHVYGVSWEPEIREYDLTEFHSYKCTEGNGNGAPGGLGPAGTEAHSVCLVCTDGVWDNWRFDDITRFCCRKSWVQAGRIASTSALTKASILDRALCVALASTTARVPTEDAQHKAACRRAAAMHCAASVTSRAHLCGKSSNPQDF